MRSGAASHLLSVPTERLSAAALAKTHARVVARYGSFTLVEAAGDDAERLRDAGADQRDDMRKVRLGRSEIDPARERVPLPAGRHGPSLAVVQFAGPVKDAWLERLRATGVRVVTYMAENGYLVRGSAEELASVRALVDSDPVFRALVAFTAADKLGPGVAAGGRQRLAVQTLSGDDGSYARGRVTGAGRKLRPTSAVGPFRTQYAELDSAEVAALADDPGVVSIQPAPQPKLFDERADQIVAGALTGSDPLLPTGPGYLGFQEARGLGSSTFPFAVDVTDEGIDQGATSSDLADFHEGGNVASASRIAYVTDYTSDPDARDCGGHGTINASIIGGFNSGTGEAVEDAQGFNYGLGVAPRVRLGGSKIFVCDSGQFELSGTFTGLAGSAYENGARVTNNSWGTDVFGAYDADSQEFDAIVRDAQPGTAGNQEMVEVVAAGNAGPADGTIGSPATGKNVIAVGASEGVRASGTDGCNTGNTRADDAHDIAPFSSRGLTDDGRFKPELVAPGTHITGSRSHTVGYNGSGVCDPAFPAGSTLYSLSTGTSHSTPVVAGMAALFREWFRQKRGGGTAVPSPALTRAALTGTATDLAGGAGTPNGVPNSDQGWGLGNLGRVLDEGSRFMFDQGTTFGATGETFSRTFTVEDPSKPVRVTLAWTDPPGPTIGNSFVNNLDLGVTTSSAAFKGNVFSAGISVPGGSADPRNNLESVYLPGGTSGSFTVTATATNVCGQRRAGQRGRHRSGLRARGLERAGLGRRPARRTRRHAGRRVDRARLVGRRGRDPLRALPAGPRRDLPALPSRVTGLEQFRRRRRHAGRGPLLRRPRDERRNPGPALRRGMRDRARRRRYGRRGLDRHSAARRRDSAHARSLTAAELREGDTAGPALARLPRDSRPVRIDQAHHGPGFRHHDPEAARRRTRAMDGVPQWEGDGPAQAHSPRPAGAEASTPPPHCRAGHARAGERVEAADSARAPPTLSG
jgi:Subtilase family